MHHLPTPAPGIATGNWGCGAFGGDKMLKSLLQLMACCVTKQPLDYYTFGDGQFMKELLEMHKHLSGKKVKVCELWHLLISYGTDKDVDVDLFTFLKKQTNKR